ncbi:unnamed protein product [Echinostoma caproni]|uniref:G_PROTEIN_RECEP_F2_3 domain-containing protein n=1 Tax=Echinostoma caproni TaxID=27848 RepID=A0A183A692_9TREM|nr:unnamed protein product [Echinostoma caproni]
MCWPTTPANQTIQLPCPAYVGGVSVSGTTRRSCRFFRSRKVTNSSGPGGHWLFDVADYDECVEADRGLVSARNV